MLRTDREPGNTDDSPKEIWRVMFWNEDEFRQSSFYATEKAARELERVLLDDNLKVISVRRFALQESEAGK